jgi:hypothetical protein
MLNLQTSLFRDIVLPTTMRSLLIVGTQSSGTMSIQSKLNDIGLEIGHETADAQWEFCRDGTVSWFHGVRFLPRGDISVKSDAREVNIRSSIMTLCAKSWDNMGFHPALYRPPKRGCSYREKWNSCWVRECVNILVQEWGCGLLPPSSSGGNGNGVNACETPFATSLLQVRHPLRIMESLTAKFCVGNVPHSDLLIFVSALFPDSKFRKNDSRCLPIVANYVASYYEAMYAALVTSADDSDEEESSSNDSTIVEEKTQKVMLGIDAFYNIEDTNPCEVMALVDGKKGINEEKLGINEKKRQELCTEGATQSTHQRHSEKRKNQWNKGEKVKITVRDIALLEPMLAARVMKICRKGGYGDMCGDDSL